MHLEVLIEDRSGAAVMQVLLHTILAVRPVTHTYAIRPHRGKGSYPQNPDRRPARFASGLMDLLPAKARAYAKSFYPEELLLIVILDSDEEAPDMVQSRIQSILSRYADPLPTVIGLCVEEMESWLLGDEQAVLAAYPDANRPILRSYEQDSICGTWEVLARAILGSKAEQVIRLGYPVVGQYKQDWARRIAPHLDPNRNQSPSFAHFRHRLEKALYREERRAILKAERLASASPTPATRSSLSEEAAGAR